jgi:Swiss Army Knife protein, DSP-PTPase phosphatase domain
MPTTAEARPPLLTVRGMPEVPGLRVPDQLYIVAMKPAPLAGMRWPAVTTPWGALGALGFHHIVCLAAAQPPYNPAPLHLACAVDLQDLVLGHAPADAEHEEHLVRRAVYVAVTKLRARQGVVVHCAGGTGRTGTVLGCVLTELGYDAPAVVAHLDDLNKQRRKRGWPEAPWQADLVLRFRR